MASKSDIQWTEATWNVTYGCTKIASPCFFCYIKRTPPYRIAGLDFDRKGHIPIQIFPERLAWPLQWSRGRRIFVDSLSDLFHADVPTSMIVDVYAVMLLAHWHTFQMLTKRPERRLELLSSHSFGDAVYDRAREIATDPAWPKSARQSIEQLSSRGWPLRNVWEGVTVGNQRDASRFVPALLSTPATVRFLSCEPLLGPLDLTAIDWSLTLLAEAERRRDELEPGDWRRETMAAIAESIREGRHEAPAMLNALTGYRTDGEDVISDGPDAVRLDWIIVGGESGPQIAPHPTPFGLSRALVERCYGDENEGHAWHPKAEARHWVRSIRDQCAAAGTAFHFKQWGGPKSTSGGRLLDGRTHDGLPTLTVPA